MKSRPRTSSTVFLAAPRNGIAFNPVSRMPPNMPFRFIVAATVARAIAVPIHGTDFDTRRDILAPPHRISRFVIPG
jgi:hypothetical protein